MLLVEVLIVETPIVKASKTIVSPIAIVSLVVAIFTSLVVSKPYSSSSVLSAKAIL